MATAWEVLQQIVSITRHVEDLQSEVKELKQDVQSFKDRVAERLKDQEVEAATLKTAQANIRDMVRSEVALSIAELRIRFAEENARRQPPSLDEQ